MNMALTFVIIVSFPAVSSFSRVSCTHSHNARRKDLSVDFVTQDFSNSLFSPNNDCPYRPCPSSHSSPYTFSRTSSPLFLRNSGGSSSSNQMNRKKSGAAAGRSSSSNTSRGIKKRTKTTTPSSSLNKNNKKEKLYYSPVGYHRGDLNTCKEMFESNCNAASGTLSYDSFVESRYLRYWPGKLTQAESIWNDIIGSCELGCSYQEMIEIHAVLDEISLNVEAEMEQERICWDIDDLNYDNMINYYHDSTANESSGLLPFRKFLLWEFIQAELWFHDSKGLTQTKLEDMWCRYVGSIHNGMDFDSFEDLYKEVRDFKYQIEG